MRFYTVLLFGITFGFSLALLLQSVSYAGVGLARDRLQEAAEYRFPGSKVTFSNLAPRQEESTDLHIDIGGYYDYERIAFQGEIGEAGEEGGEKVDRKEPEKAEGERGNHAAVKDSREKQREYVSETWQGRNVRETKGNAPVAKLTEELVRRKPLLIAVITTVNQLMSQTLAIHGTWGGEAAQVVYFTGGAETLPHLPHGMVVVQLDGLDDEQTSFETKEIAAISYITNTYLQNTDWFLVVNDESYVASARLEDHLNKLEASMPVYMGRPLISEEEAKKEEEEERKNLADKLCDSSPGIVYSRGLLEKLKPYLPVCWPGHGMESEGMRACISVMGLSCTAAREVRGGEGVRACVCVCVRVRCVCVHACVRAYVPVRVCYVHTCVHASVFVCVCACVRAYVRACVCVVCILVYMIYTTVGGRGGRRL